MTNRREFLQIGVTAGAWPLVSRAVPAASGDASSRTLPIFAVVFDSRFPESAAFAARSQALGLNALPIAANGDMTQLWFHEIHPSWSRAPAALAGLTAYGPMFCFAELARDVRMRLVFRAAHRVVPPRVAHTFWGPMPMVSHAVSGCGSESLGAAMADVVSRCPAGMAEMASADLVAGSASPGHEPLYTWVIAPAVRA